MPYASQAQQRFFHTDTAQAKGITPDVVDEFDQASKGLSLPKKKGKSSPAIAGLEHAAKKKAAPPMPPPA